MAPHAFVTLLTSDSYLPGALVAAHALKENEKHSLQDIDLVCLAALDIVSLSSVKILQQVFDFVLGVDEIGSSHCEKELNLLGRQELSSSVTKIHVWRLAQYQKIIYIDADTLPIRPMSHLFTLEASFSACADTGWPDCFNSGLMVIRPSEEMFEKIFKHFIHHGSWDGGDQGLLNDFFTVDSSRTSSASSEDPSPCWNRLSFIYNVTPSAYYSYAPAYKRYHDEISMIHFIGPEKPWHQIRQGRIKNSQSFSPYSPSLDAIDYASLVQRWFDVYQRAYGSAETSGWPVPESDFQIPKYAAQWDKQFPDHFRALSLEEVKQMNMRHYESQYSQLTQPHNSKGQGTWMIMRLPEGFELYSKTRAHPPKTPLTVSHNEKIEMPTQNDIPTSTSSDKVEQVDTSSKDDAPIVDHKLASSHDSVWDASRAPPPSQGYQMTQPITQRYEAVWDKPVDQQSQGFFRPPAQHPMGYIPPVTHQDYSQFSTSPQPDAIKPVFPWEDRSRTQAGRTFPEEVTAPKGNQQTISTLTTEAEKSSEGPKVAQPIKLSERYKNAWDDLPNISQRSQNRGVGSMPTQTGRGGWKGLESQKGGLVKTPHLQLKGYFDTERDLEETGLDLDVSRNEVVGRHSTGHHQEKQVTLSYRMRRDSENSSRNADEEDIGEDDEPMSDEVICDEREMNDLLPERIGEGMFDDRGRPKMWRGHERSGPISRLPTMRSTIIGLPVGIRKDHPHHRSQIVTERLQSALEIESRQSSP